MEREINGEMSEGGKSTVVANSGSADARVGLRSRDEKHAREREKIRRENTLDWIETRCVSMMLLLRPRGAA